MTGSCRISRMPRGARVALDGGPGGDDLHGEVGDDLLEGSDGDDVLDGGSENDHLDGGVGVDQFFGGEGDDTFVNDDGLAETVDCGPGAADDPEPSASDTFVGCELI